MNQYNIVLSTGEDTVVTEYEPQGRRSEAYQSEADLEAAFIKLLEGQGYEYIKIRNSEGLIANLRAQLEKLNNYKFSNDEWERFFKNNIASPEESIKQKTEKIQEKDTAISLTLDDGSHKNIRLLDKKNIHNNFLQVINQYEEDNGNYKNRYDVTILVNGLPLVHVELKRRGIALREAFNQINRYQRDSFGRVQDYMNMCKYSLLVTVRIQNIIPTQRGTGLSKKKKTERARVKRRIIVLSLPHFGLMEIIKLLLT